MLKYSLVVIVAQSSQGLVLEKCGKRRPTAELCSIATSDDVTVSGYYNINLPLAPTPLRLTGAGLGTGHFSHFQIIQVSLKPHNKT